jgi:hypothetical protein
VYNSTRLLVNGEAISQMDVSDNARQKTKPGIQER